jgi:aminopeptidase N
MTDRELVDRHEDDIIAHELFHHWFGNLVTCESWANLPLNESFATYGEYIWREKWLGRLGADMHLENDLQNYLNESRVEQKDMIRFNYEDKEDMFDSHSYAKGGRILHMLRYHLGDDAFYSGLQKYLKDNAFNTVEIHQLRLAMEEVSGEDLNWFFNQWFLASGHPILAVDYKYNEAKKQQTVIIQQIQDQGTTPVYKLPFNIDVYEEGQTKRHAVTMTESKHEFVFDVNSKPINVIVDSEHVLLAEIFEEKPDDWWIEQMHAPLYMDMVFALRNVSEKGKENAILHALNNNNWPIQLAGIEEA